MALGSLRRSCSASSVSSQAQLMFDLGQGFRLFLVDLLKSVPYLLGFRRRQHVVGIYDALRLDEHAVGLFTKRHEVPLLELEGFEDFPRDDHLAALSHAPDPLSSCGCLRCHAFRLSDCQNLSRPGDLKGTPRHHLLPPLNPPVSPTPPHSAVSPAASLRARRRRSPRPALTSSCAHPLKRWQCAVRAPRFRAV